MVLIKKTQQPTLKEVSHQFKIWRSTRKGKSCIPEELWDAAASLSSQYSINRIARSLSLSYSALKNRATVFRANNAAVPNEEKCFLELPSLDRPQASKCLIEMENMQGEKMRMHFSGEIALDLFALSQNFWARRL